MGDRDGFLKCDTYAKPVKGRGVVIARDHKETSVATKNVSSEVKTRRKRRRAREPTETSPSHRESNVIKERAKLYEQALIISERDIKFHHGSNKTTKGGIQACQVGSGGIVRDLNGSRGSRRTGHKGHIASQASSSAAQGADKANVYFDVSLSGQVEPHHSAEVNCTKTDTFNPSDWILCDIYKSSRCTEETFIPEGENFAAQAPTENTLNVNLPQNGPWVGQYQPMEPTTMTYLKHNPSKKHYLMQDGGYQLPPKSRESNLCESPLKLDSSQPLVLSMFNQHTSPSHPVPHTRNSSLKETSSSNNSSRSAKHSYQHFSQSKSHSSEKRLRHSSPPSLPKKHPPRRRTRRSHSPLPPNYNSPIISTRQSHSAHSKSDSPMKRSQSRSSRSNKHSPAKRNSCSPQSSKSNNVSPLRTSNLRSSRSKNRSPVKRTSGFSSSRSISRSPLRKTSRLDSSRFKSRTPSRRVSRSRSSRSKTRSPLSRIRSSRSKSCSPLKRTHRLHSSSSECHSPLNKTSSIRSYQSKSPSPFRKTSRLRSSHSRSRSPLRRHKRLCSSHSKSRSPSRRTSQSRNRSPIKRTRSKSSSPKANNSSQRCFAVRVDICTNLADDKTLKEVIFQRFVKFGFVTSVEVHHSFCGDRYVLVFYDQRHELEEALIGAPKMRLYSKKIEVTPWTGRKVGDDCDSNMWEDEMTKFSPVSTRTLLIENLSKAIAPEKLDNICVQFDDILDIDIQQEPEKSTCSALVEFYSITSLIKAAKALNKDFFGTSQVKVTFAKSRPTSCLWLDGLPANLTLDYLTLRFSEYGPCAKTLYNCLKGMALVFYKHEKDAVAAMKELKCGLGKVSGSRVMVDFANDRTELAFCQAMEASGQNVGDFNAH